LTLNYVSLPVKRPSVFSCLEKYARSSAENGLGNALLYASVNANNCTHCTEEEQ